ncbi:MAG: methyltransferase domain-containing protein [Rickettsiales bacterium]
MAQPLDSRTYDKRVRADFSRAANHYDVHATLQRDVVDATYPSLLPRLTHDASVLDAGCGTGYLARSLAEKYIGWRVFQLDSAEGMCRKAGKYTICGDMTQLPLLDNSMDAIFSSLSLQWVSEPMTALREWYRVTKPRGFAAIATLGPATLRELRECQARAGVPESVLTFQPLARLEDAAQQTGWKILSSHASLRRQIYDDTVALLRQLKGLGATAKDRSPLKPSQLNALIDIYQTRAEHGKNVYATYEIMTLLLAK